MACRYALVVGSDYRDWLELKSYFARSFITSLVQPFFCALSFRMCVTIWQNVAFSCIKY